MATFKCTACGFAKQVPAEYAGKRLKCPKCRAESQVEATGNQPLAPAPADAKPMIKFLCPHCGQKIGVAAQHAGKKVRCTKCTQPVTIPASSQAAPASPARKPSAPKPPAPPKPPASQEETDELSLKMEPMAEMDDLLSMEKQMQAVERVADMKKPKGPGGPSTGEAVSELMRLQAKAAGRGITQEPGKPVNIPVLMTVCTIGAFSSLAVLAMIAVFLFVPAPRRSYAEAEAFIHEFMNPPDIYAAELAEEGPAVAEPNVVEPNAPDLESNEPDAAQSDDPEHEPVKPDEALSEEAISAVDDSDEIESAVAAAERSPRNRLSFPTAERRLPYGPELVAAMAEEQEQVQQYYDRHKEDNSSMGSMGAIERMTPISSGLSQALSLMHSEPSLALVRRAQCYMPGNGEFGFSLMYRPSRSGDMDQMLIFHLETKGSEFVIQGVQGKKTIGGWAAAMPPRASEIMSMTGSPEIVRKVLSLPGWSLSIGLPAVAVTGIIWLGAIWVIFAKTGRIGSASLVPVYNLWALADVGGRPGWLSLLVAGAAVALIFGGVVMYGAIAAAAAIMLFISLGVASELNKGVLFGLGLWLLPAVFYPILAATTES